MLQPSFEGKLRTSLAESQALNWRPKAAMYTAFVNTPGRFPLPYGLPKPIGSRLGLGFSSRVRLGAVGLKVYSSLGIGARITDRRFLRTFIMKS